MLIALPKVAQIFSFTNSLLQSKKLQFTCKYVYILYMIRDPALISVIVILQHTTTKATSMY